MVKLGGVRNYVVGTWSPSDLEACAAMNLPCADLSPWLPEPMNNGPGAGGVGSQHDYLVSFVFGLFPCLWGVRKVSASEVLGCRCLRGWDARQQEAAPQLPSLASHLPLFCCAGHWLASCCGGCGPDAPGLCGLRHRCEV